MTKWAPGPLCKSNFTDVVVFAVAVAVVGVVVVVFTPFFIMFELIKSELGCLTRNYSVVMRKTPTTVQKLIQTIMTCKSSELISSGN